jgi:imidazole glycerol-phosphate synthase subunit HisF
VIPCLLLSGGRLVKTVQFQDPKYVGDPINAVRIFNDKEADELVVLDIEATLTGIGPDEQTIEEMVTEAFMPVSYGGGVTSVEMALRLIRLGVEKIVVNTAAVRAPSLIAELADHLGSSTLVVSIDARIGSDRRYELMTMSGRESAGRDAIEFAQEAAELGAGEILLTSIDRDGTRLGYDLELISRVAELVAIPVIASGGAGSLEDLTAAVQRGGASAVAAGSLFVFHGPHRAVLITYPSYPTRVRLFAAQGESDASNGVNELS